MKEDNTDTIYLHEYMMDLDTGDEVNYYITNKYTIVDSIENIKNLCESNMDFNGISMNILNNAMSSIAHFTYQDYTYCINITYPSSEEILFDVVEQMLETARA